jgi:hypothetical protein
LTLFVPPHRPKGAEKLKFTIYAPPSLSLKYIIPNLKRIGAVVIKKLKMLTDTIYHVYPPLGAKPLP